jgi:hypothetical protein
MFSSTLIVDGFCAVAGMPWLARRHTPEVGQALLIPRTGSWPVRHVGAQIPLASPSWEVAGPDQRLTDAAPTAILPRIALSHRRATRSTTFPRRQPHTAPEDVEIAAFQIPCQCGPAFRRLNPLRRDSGDADLLVGRYRPAGKLFHGGLHYWRHAARHNRTWRCVFIDPDPG